MKTFNFILLVSLLVSTAAFAQPKVNDKIVIKTPAAVCEACATHIENLLGREDGIISVKVDIKKKTTTVVFITDRINGEIIKTDLADLGFDADDVTAEPTAVRRLPVCCQKVTPVTDSTAKKTN